MIGKKLHFLSYLDLIACSFGGALLLFLLIAASARPQGQRHTPDSLLLVRCRHRNGPRAEVGLWLRRPSSPSWERAQTNGRDVYFFSAPSGKESGSEAVLVVRSPEHGTWKFRPYLVDFPRQAAGQEGTGVQFEVVGDRVQAALDEGAEQVMLWPGTARAAFSVRVEPEGTRP